MSLIENIFTDHGIILSTAYEVTSGTQEEVVGDVAHTGGFLLINLFGGQIFVQGKIKRLDFVDKHSVVLEENIGNRD